MYVWFKLAGCEGAMTGKGEDCAAAGEGGNPVPRLAFGVSGTPAKQEVAAWHEALSSFVEFKLIREGKGRLAWARTPRIDGSTFRVSPARARSV